MGCSKIMAKQQLHWADVQETEFTVCIGIKCVLANALYLKFFSDDLLPGNIYPVLSTCNFHSTNVNTADSLEYDSVQYT